MVYKYKKIICPYHNPNNHCVHKGCDKYCRFKNNEIKCRAYKEWYRLNLRNSGVGNESTRKVIKVSRNGSKRVGEVLTEDWIRRYGKTDKEKFRSLIINLWI